MASSKGARSPAGPGIRVIQDTWQTFFQRLKLNLHRGEPVATFPPPFPRPRLPDIGGFAMRSHGVRGRTGSRIHVEPVFRADP